MVAGMLLAGGVARAADGPVKVEVRKGADGTYALLARGEAVFHQGGGAAGGISRRW